LISVLGALALCLAGKLFLRIDAMGFAVLFLSGMAVASLLHENMKPRISPNVSSAMALACLTVIFATSDGGYGTTTAVLLALFFYLVCSGATLFGLLTTTPAHRLGNISYSLYLMQGLVLTVVFSNASIRTFAMASPLEYWVIGVVCACVLLLGSALSYVFIERPGIALGKRLGATPAELAQSRAPNVPRPGISARPWRAPLRSGEYRRRDPPSSARS
jgi:peptidoglycan/LPS O-acetylase OafA/YrhL